MAIEEYQKALFYLFCRKVSFEVFADSYGSLTYLKSPIKKNKDYFRGNYEIYFVVDFKFSFLY
jgi:hypothetical protein